MSAAETKPPKGKEKSLFTPSPERRGQRRLADNLRRLTKGLCAEQGFAQSDIITRWRDIVGPHLADHCVSERLSFPRGQDGGTLHIVAGGAFATELQHMAPEIIERINGYFGFPAVARLALRQAPISLIRRRRPKPKPLTEAQRRALGEATRGIQTPDLKAALERLGAAMLTTPD
jgi:hypothetical protein